MEYFRLLDTPPMSAAENMALDDALLELKGQGRTPDTLHFLQFSPRAVLVGFHQSVAEEVSIEYCSAHGIDINRRITGGGAIFMDEGQLGWELICDKSLFNLTCIHTRFFKKLCDPVVAALNRLGVKAIFRPRNDIEVNGRKISGTGGTESEGAFLFHGSVLVDFDVDTMVESLRIPVEKLSAREIDSIKQRVTCLTWEVGHTPPLQDVKGALQFGFEKHLGITLEPAGLTDSEKRLFEEKLNYFQSSDWIDQVKPQCHARHTVQVAHRAKGGMVRYTCVVDVHKKRVKDVYITGDFISFPARALYDLESRLRGAPLERDHIRGIIRNFFEDGRMHVPGMTWYDFLRPMDQIVEKTAILKFEH